MSPKLGVVALALVLAAVAPARAGAWTAPRGGSYHRIAANYFTSDTEFTSTREERPFQLEGRFRDSNLTYYGEYGFRDDLTVFGSVPLKTVHYENLFEEGTTSGVADVDVGLRYRILAAPVVFSVQGSFKVPGGYDGTDRLPLGNSQIDFEARLLAGRSTRSGRLYGGAEAAYRFRAEDPSDEWRFLLELGGSFTKSVYARAKLDQIRSAENAADVTDIFGNPLTQLEAELRRIEVTLGWSFSRRWSAEVAWAPVFYGKSTAKGSTWTLAATCVPGPRLSPPTE